MTTKELEKTLQDMTVAKELEKTLQDMTVARTDATRPQESPSAMKELNIALLRTIVDHWEGRQFAGDYSDYSPFMREYRDHAESHCQAQEALPYDPKK
jgi:hypothetical protein